MNYIMKGKHIRNSKCVLLVLKIYSCYRNDESIFVRIIVCKIPVSCDMLKKYFVGYACGGNACGTINKFKRIDI